jgi:hypothetical protein
MDALTGILAAFGLSTSAGLNAYLPLLIVGLAARYTHFIHLNAPWDTLENPIVLAVLAVLLLIETFADKFPAVNHLNDAIQTLVRPTAGAILFAASANVISDVHPVVALILGLFAAGTVHAVKSVLLRPAVTATTGGVANPVVSLGEDIVAATVSIIAIVLPVLITGVVIIVTALIVWLLWRKSNRNQPAPAR